MAELLSEKTQRRWNQFGVRIRKLGGTDLRNKFWKQARTESCLRSKFWACKKSCDSVGVRDSFACPLQSFLFSSGSFYSSHANSSWEQSQLHWIWPRSEMSQTLPSKIHQYLLFCHSSEKTLKIYEPKSQKFSKNCLTTPSHSRS